MKMVFTDDPTEQYLAKATEAEEMAERATDASMKRTWSIIAKSYRELAMFMKYPMARSKNPS